jgi:medium-chain acyl-[acyl-carrier-protein] hydrolase
MPVITTSPWLVTLAPNPAARLRLFCFPYAGCGASMYATWHRALPADVEVSAVQMPGRESRLKEPPLRDWDELGQRLEETLSPWAGQPLALFGHSLGALIAFEMAQRLTHAPGCRLAHVFVSGCRAPHLSWDDMRTQHLPRAAFVEELRRLQGTPADVLACPEVLDLFLPTLRADFGLVETYIYRERPPLSVPISVYGGIADESASPAALSGWHRHTTSSHRQVMFPGTHFFLTEQPAAVFSALTNELQGIVAAVSSA